LHVVDPAADEKPGEQLSQDVEPGNNELVPAGPYGQDEEPADEYWPTSQVEQNVSPIEEEY
jgi:hypothetical protein